MLKKILSVLLGVVTGIIIVFAGDMTTHFIYPMPEGVDFHNKNQMQEIMLKIPVTALVIMMGFWLLSSFLGAFVAAKINKAAWKKSAIITGSILMAATLLNVFMLPHPVWMMVTTILLYIPCAYLGGKLAS